MSKHYSPLVRETLDGWQAGRLEHDTESEEFPTAQWCATMLQPSRHLAETTAEILCAPEYDKSINLGPDRDDRHADFDSDLGLVTAGMVDDYVTQFGEPEAEILPELDRAFGPGHAIAAAIDQGEPGIGGLRAVFEWEGWTFATPATHRTALAAKMTAIAARAALCEMLGDRRPEDVTRLRVEELPGLTRIEVTRGPEVRVYQTPPWLLGVVQRVLG